MGNGRQNPDLGFEQLYAQARESVPIIRNLGDTLLSDLQTIYPGLFDAAKFEIGPLKRLDRATDKIIGDYEGDHTRICDLARGRIVIDTIEQIEALRIYLQENKEAFGIEKYDDRFAEPGNTGFRDINMNMRLPNGHVIEFRVEHRAILDVAKVTHDLYEQIQEIDRTTIRESRDLTEEEEFKRQSLFDEIRDIHEHPARTAALNQLLNNKGRKKLEAHEQSRITPYPSPEKIAKRIAYLTKELAKKKQSTPEEPDISMSEALARLFNFHHQNKSGDKGGSAADQATPKTQKSIKPVWKKDLQSIISDKTDNLHILSTKK